MWRKTHLGLHKQARHHKHAWLHWGGTYEVPTPQTNSATTLPLQGKTTIHYGTKVQRVEEDKSPPLTPEQIKSIQKIMGTLLYYGHAVDSTLLTALSAIATRQSNGTHAIAKACHQLLDYVAMHPDAGICYHACMPVT